MESPQADELRSRISRHLHQSGGAPEVMHLWSGYLAALIEWGLIDGKTHRSLCGLISGVREDILYHLFADQPMPERTRD